MSPKRAARAEAFKKLGRSISARKDEQGYDGYHQFEINPMAVADRQLSLKVGPKLKTQQWERTVRK